MDYGFLINKYFDDNDDIIYRPLRPLDDITKQIAKWSIPPVSVDIDWGSAVTDTTDTPPRITVSDGDEVVYPHMPACWDSPNVALGGVLIKPEEQCFILCTPSMKERILQLAESSWDKCPFTDGCNEFYGYDCRKCLEHRIKWKLTD